MSNVKKLNSLKNPLIYHVQNISAIATYYSALGWTIAQFMAPYIFNYLNDWKYPFLGATSLSLLAKIGYRLPPIFGLKLPLPANTTVFVAAFVYFLWKQNDVAIAQKLDKLQKSIDAGFQQVEIDFEELKINLQEKQDSLLNQIKESTKVTSNQLDLLQKENNENQKLFLEKLNLLQQNGATNTQLDELKKLMEKNEEQFLQKIEELKKSLELAATKNQVDNLKELTQKIYNFINRSKSEK